MKITTLGTSGGEGGYPFAEYAIPDGARIAAIRVLSGWYVDSIQLVYADAAGNETPMETVGGAGLHFAERENLFVLDSDEYLVGISGTSGQYVDNIRFHTNKRDSELFGGRGGDNSFSFMADAGSQVIGFFGRADWYLDAIGVLVKKMPATEAPKKAVKKAAAPVAAAAEAPKKAAKKATAKKEAVVEAPVVEAPAAEAPKKAAKKATAKKEAAVEAPAVEAPAAEAPRKAAKKATAKKDAAAEPVVAEATRAAAVVEAIAVTPDD
ncbi:MAG TPA: jacalin-like lectin, partial [Caldilinea sp.]|nr:jacalin-like lectin [Caldilinea sp.]